MTMKGVKFKVSTRKLEITTNSADVSRASSVFRQSRFNKYLYDPQAPVIMDNGRISVHFPQYHFTAEVVGDKLIMVKEPTYQSN